MDDRLTHGSLWELQVCDDLFGDFDVSEGDLVIPVVNAGGFAEVGTLLKVRTRLEAGRADGEPLPGGYHTVITPSNYSAILVKRKEGKAEEPDVTPGSTPLSDPKLSISDVGSLMGDFVRIAGAEDGADLTSLALVGLAVRMGLVKVC